MKITIYLKLSTLLFCFLSVPESDAGYYANKVYPVIRERHPDLIQAVNDYLISVEEKNLSKSELLPKLDLVGDVGYSQSKVEKNETGFQTDATARLIFQQPIFDLQRWYALERSKKNQEIAGLQKSLRQDQFLLTFVEGLLRLSQNKTRYFFARQNLAYFQKYFEQEKERERSEHDQNNPGKDFDWTRSLLLLTLDQDLRSGTRGVETLYSAYINERTAFEVSILQKPLEYFIMVNPFVKRQPIPTSEDEVVAAVKRSNPALNIAKRGLEINEIDIREARRLRWPKASLVAKTGYGNHNYDAGSEYSREDFVGLIFTLPLFDGFSTKAKQKIAALNKNNALKSVQLLEMSLEEQTRITYKSANQNVKNINSLIESFNASKRMIKIFLGEMSDPRGGTTVPASNADRKRIMDTHFTISRDLAMEQHLYLSNLIQLYFLHGRFDQRQFSTLEDQFFVNCNDYERFVEIGEIR